MKFDIRFEPHRFSANMLVVAPHVAGRSRARTQPFVWILHLTKTFRTTWNIGFTMLSLWFRPHTITPTITLTSLSLWACRIFSLDYTPLENVAFSSDDSIIRIAYQLWMSRTIKIHYMTSKFGRKYWRNERFFGASKIRWKIHLKCVLE